MVNKTKFKDVDSVPLLKREELLPSARRTPGSRPQ